MSVNVANFGKLNELVSLNSGRRPKLVLDPSEEYILKLEQKEKSDVSLDTNMIVDKVSWKIPNEIKEFVDEVSQNTKLNNEEKILAIYKKISEEYIYDDNILSYITRDDERFYLPDWYGKDVDETWETARSEHRRRVCYEVSRYLAKSLSKILDNNNEYNVCILYDKDITHYYVGLTCKDYTLTLDVDEFNKIKDLTRIKTGLTAEGIQILEDNDNKFGNELKKFNKGKSEHAIRKMTEEVNKRTHKETQGQIQEEPEDITFLRNAVEILVEEYGLDSQGIFEYMKEIVDIKLGSELREKVWKKLDDSKSDTRYTRCLVLNMQNQKYIIDSDKKILREFDEEEFDGDNPRFIPFKSLHNTERYGGR